MFHYNGIDNTILTFIAGTDCAEGAVCKLSGSSMVKGCSDGDAFHGLVQKIYPGKVCGAVVRGVVRVAYTGTTPTAGWAKLVADSSGGVKIDEDKVDDVNAAIPAAAKEKGEFVLHKGKKVHIRVLFKK